MISLLLGGLSMCSRKRTNWRTCKVVFSNCSLTCRRTRMYHFGAVFKKQVKCSGSLLLLLSKLTQHCPELEYVKAFHSRGGQTWWRRKIFHTANSSCPNLSLDLNAVHHTTYNKCKKEILKHAACLCRTLNSICQVHTLLVSNVDGLEVNTFLWWGTFLVWAQAQYLRHSKRG